MKRWHPALAFIVIMLVVSGFLSHRYHRLTREQLTVRQASQQSAYSSIVNTFRLVSKTLYDEVLQNESLLRHVDDIVTSEGEQRNQLRGALYRKLHQMYARVSQHSIRQFHFHFPDGRSMLRLHTPQRADDPLFAHRYSVKIANTEQREVHGYESGRIVHGFRHVYPLNYQGRHIGSVEVSNSFQQINSEIKNITAINGTEMLFVMYKPDLWHKLPPELQHLYVTSPLHSDYLEENQQACAFKSLGGTVTTPAYLKELEQQLTQRPEVRQGIRTQASFSLLANYDYQVYSVLFHSIQNTENKHAAYLISVTPEPKIQALRNNTLLQLILAGGVTLLVLGYRSGLTQSRRKERQVADFLHTLSSSMGEGLYATDRQGRVSLFNPEAQRLLGYQEQEALGQEAHALFHVDEQPHDNGCFLLNSILMGVSCKQEQTFFKNKAQRKFPVELTSTPIYDKQQIVGTITLFRDISDRLQQQQELVEAKKQLEQANRHLNELALMDALTGVANRREFDQTVESLWRGGYRKKEPLAILMIDIDHFKAYNDHFGHQQGDTCLRQVAQQIKSACLRPDDFVARYGGEEFVALLPHTDLDNATYIARRIQKRLRQAALAHPQSPVNANITLSIGVCAMIPDDLSSTQKLIDCADRRLYRAKAHGRNQICQTDD